jgi:hypothetical protein
MRTLRIFCALLATYLVLALPGLYSHAYYDSGMGLLLWFPYNSIRLFARFIPGLVTSSHFCGWGWCLPTTLGWCFLATLWSGTLWCLAWTVHHATNRRGGAG